MNLTYVIIGFQLIAFLFAISIHESAHAWMASRCGDPTARMLGRVTLNPIKHIDLFGTVLLPIICAFTRFPIIGWAKPTPVDPRNFRNPVRDDILTSVAGPASNLLVCLASVVVLAVISAISPAGRMVVQSYIHGMIYEAGALTPIVLMLYQMMFINILLAIFNLIPIPPLDGSHVLRHALPESARDMYDRIGLIGLFALLIFGGNFLWRLMAPVVGLFNAILMRI